MSKLYHLTYKVTSHKDGIAADQVPKGHGACDALMMQSIIYPDDGSFSMLGLGTDGRTDTNVTSSEMFKVWTLLAKQLGDDPTLSESKRELCLLVFKVVCDAVAATAKREEQG